MATAAGKTTTTSRKATEKATTSTPKAPRKEPKIIRNLRGTVVHMRLYSQSPKDPFRVELKPRGLQGDTTIIPVVLQEDPTYLQGLDVLFEIITKTEFAEIRANYGPVGYLGRTDAPIIERPQDNTVMTADDWDGKGKRVPEDRNILRKHANDRTGMNVVDVPGSDTGLHEHIREGQKRAEGGGQTALPGDVDITSRKVSIERAKG